MPPRLNIRLHKKLVEIRNRQRSRMDAIHALCHEFMRDFDRAVLVHEQIAELEGRDPKEATEALWEVRTEKQG